MYDLEYQGSSLVSEANAWTATSLVNSGVKTSTCAGDTIVGGYNVLGGNYGQYWQRYYSGIPTHNVIYLSIKIFPIDSWDGDSSNDHFELYFDGIYLVCWRLEGYDSMYASTNLCGRSNFNDLRPMMVYATVPHTSGSLYFRVINGLDQNSDDESLGFREVTMTFAQIASPPASADYCGVTYGNPLTHNVCGCSDGTYMYPPSSGNCASCDSTCLTCSGAGSGACSSCPDGRYLVGATCQLCNSNCLTCSGAATTCTNCNPGWFMVGTTCYSSCNYPLYSYTSGTGVLTCATPCPGQYVWWDQTCSSSCAYSNAYGSYTLQPVTVNTFAQCNYPCGTGQFLYFNTSCLNNCPDPLSPAVYKVRNFCGYSCGSSQYLYWNGSCLNNCPWPLSPETQGTILPKQFCWYYCQPSQYLYWNGSCLNNCPSPLSSELQGTYLQRQFCWYACQPSQYLYWNGSCLNSCPWPLSPEIEGSIVTYKRNFCWYYCQPGEYMYWNGSCLSTCPSPLTPEIQGTNLPRKFCWYSCQPSEYLYWNGSCLSTCPWPLSPEVEGSIATYKRNFCWYYCQPGEYMYWNGSCLSTCPSPLTPEIQGTNLPRKFCWYTCQPSEYLYWNGSCLSTCPWPLSPEVEGSIATYKRNFCWYYCQPGEYMYWNGSCLSTCPWPLTPEIQGTYLPRQFCWYTCQPSQYLYWNGSCMNSCPWPLSPETQGTTSYKRNFCWYTCQPSEWLYWNGSCISDCPSPLAKETQGTYLPRQFCWYLCQPNQFLYWNLSCLNSCPAPLTPETQGSIPVYQRNFCWYTCQPSQFLLWNYTCSNTCPSPLTNEVQGTYLARKFCWYPCMPWQWLNWDQTCQQTCTSPLWPETQGTYLPRQFCWYPCTAESKFLYWNGTCLPQCPEPLKTRYQNGQWFCDYPCSTGQFLYWNGSCLGSCVAPLAQRLEGNPVRQFCYYLCPTNQFLYWDSTCQSTCNFPLVPVSQGYPGRQYCWYLCPVNQFLYWNGTCSSQCDPPLTQRTTNGRNFCDYSCAPNQYLAWNNTCVSTCPYPLSVRTEGSPIKKNFCDFPCAATKYLYWNGSCLDSCNSPLSTRIEGSRKFCDYPCVGNQYLYWNGTCKTTCGTPLMIRIDLGRRYCDYPCPAGQIMYWDGSCSSSCNSPLVSDSQGTPSRNYCKYPCSQSQFLYWNGTCANSCDFPLTSYVFKGRLFCKYPCLTTQVLHFNGSCLNSCPSMLVVRSQSGLNYCDYPCQNSEYLYWNGSCMGNCIFPLVSRTIENLKYCDFPCSMSTDFLYWNGTCSSQCNTPLTQKLEGTKKFCVSSCSPTQYLYWNSSCLGSCDFPLVHSNSSSVKFCHYPCNSMSEYLYWNGSCLSQCNFPLSSHNTAGLKYCDYPCSSSSYLYWNSSCLPNCNLPLLSRAENNKQYCDFPCSSVADFLYWDSTCSSSCNSPLISKTEGSKKYCLNTCDSSDFTYWNGSCLRTCPSPFIQKTDSKYRYCYPPCPNKTMFYYEELQACYSECKQPAYIDNTRGYLRCLPLQKTALQEESSSLLGMLLHAPLEQNTLTIVKLVKPMQYVKYLDINMPPRLHRLGMSKGRNVLSFSSSMQMSIEIQNHFVKQALPFAYLQHNLHSSFLVNFWEDLMNLLIAVAIACIFLVFEKIFRALDWVIPEVVCQTLRVIAKWNFVIMVLAINIDDIILFSALEFKSLDFPKSSGISLALAIIFICLILALTAEMIFYIVKKRKTNFTVPEDFQVLFNGFRENSTLCQLFFVLYMLRIGVPMLLAVCLEITPIGNTILQALFSGSVIVFLIIKKPFIKKINHYQILLFETIVLLMNTSMLALTILSHYHLHNSHPAVILGDIVILGNDIINFMCLAILVIKIHIDAKMILSFTKKHNIPRKIAVGLWLQLLYIPLQLSHMGFEEMTAYNIAKHDPKKNEVEFRKKKLGKSKAIHERQNEFDHSAFEPIKEISSSIDITDRNHLMKTHSLTTNRERLQITQDIDQFDRLETFGDHNDLAVSYSASQIQYEKNNETESLADFSPNIKGNNRETISKNKFSDDESLKNNLSSHSIKVFANNSSPSNEKNRKGILKKNSLPSFDQSLPDNNEFQDTIDFKSRIADNSVKSFYDDLQQLVSRNNSEDAIVSIGNSRAFNITNPRIKPPQLKGENEKKEGWEKVRRHFQSEDQSIARKPKEEGSVFKGEKLDERVTLNLWQGGRKLFNSSKKK